MASPSQSPAIEDASVLAPSRKKPRVSLSPRSQAQRSNWDQEWRKHHPKKGDLGIPDPNDMSIISGYTSPTRLVWQKSGNSKEESASARVIRKKEEKDRAGGSDTLLTKKSVEQQPPQNDLDIDVLAGASNPYYTVIPSELEKGKGPMIMKRDPDGLAADYFDQREPNQPSAFDTNNNNKRNYESHPQPPPPKRRVSSTNSNANASSSSHINHPQNRHLTREHALVRSSQITNEMNRMAVKLLVLTDELDSCHRIIMESM